MTEKELLEIRDKILNPLTIIVGTNMKNQDPELRVKIQAQCERIDAFIKGLDCE